MSKQKMSVGGERVMTNDWRIGEQASCKIANLLNSEICY